MNINTQNCITKSTNENISLQDIFQNNLKEKTAYLAFKILSHLSFSDLGKFASINKFYYSIIGLFYENQMNEILNDYAEDKIKMTSFDKNSNDKAINKKSLKKSIQIFCSCYAEYSFFGVNVKLDSFEKIISLKAEILKAQKQFYIDNLNSLFNPKPINILNAIFIFDSNSDLSSSITKENYKENLLRAIHAKNSYTLLSHHFLSSLFDENQELSSSEIDKFSLQKLQNFTDKNILICFKKANLLVDDHFTKEHKRIFFKKLGKDHKNFLLETLRIGFLSNH